MKKFGIIGTGNMATAILKGILKENSISPDEIMAYNVNEVSLAKFCECGIIAAKSQDEVVQNCRFILLAVKPQMYPAVLEKIATFDIENTVFISIAAGIDGDYIKNFLGNETKIVLAMPNTPMLIGCGAVSVAKVSPVTDSEFSEVKEIFSASALVSQVEPSQMSESIPLHGSSPAFFYLVAQTFVEKAVSMGIDSKSANELVCQSLIGSANMMLKTDKNHQELIDMVCSKGGATLAMLDAMNKAGVKDAINNGIDACVNRAYELGK